VKLRHFEQGVLAVFGFVLVVVGVVATQVSTLPMTVRAAVAVPFVATGVAGCWAATLGWPVGEPEEHRESPALLLPVERMFLAPIGGLGALGLVAFLVDRNLEMPVRLLLVASTLVVTLVLVGLVLGRVQLPARHLGRQQPGPSPPGRGEL
jgi:hypothetical protein